MKSRKSKVESRAPSGCSYWLRSFFWGGFFLLPPLAGLAQTATNDSLILAPPYDELPPSFWEQHGGLVVFASVACILVLSIVGWVCLKKKQEPDVPPDILARDALVKLQAEPEDGKVLSAVSQILRRYFTAAFSLSESEQTTAEFCSVVESDPRIGAELAQGVTGFLRECDVRKFSPAYGTATLNAATRALEFIQQSEVQLERLKQPGRDHVGGAGDSTLKTAAQ